MLSKKIAVLGAGKSGLSSYKHYKNLGYDVVIWDENPKAVESLEGEYSFLSYEKWDYQNLDFIITSPGIALEHPKKHYVLEKSQEFNVKIYVDIELFIKENPQIKYIAVSGTNGKSTTTALIQHIFENAGKKCTYAGNIGIPVFDINPAMYEYIVLELSSYQIDLMNDIHFNCALLLNIQEDHLDHHGTFENYKQVKYRLFENQNFNDIAIVDSNLLKELQEAIPYSKIIPITTDKTLQGANILVDENHITDNYFSNNKNVVAYEDLLYLKGEHNYLNISFAYAVANFFNLAEEDIIKGILSFKGLKHRQNNLGRINNITFINDSKATNQESTLQALKAFSDIYLILGGIAKSANLDVILPYLKQVKGIFLIGSSTPVFSKILQENKISFVVCKNLQDATLKAYETAVVKGTGTVLLSPACSSFDEFKSFEHRGDTFVDIVKDIKS
ncbi:MAG: UDP-N-acetylmuramoyl-L-alanine--D-glutamate ligase [Alphaproteobacteria bacterium]|jgi:UDP-N-acetylmuramoylalanine--D-glutamate ligase|nr:UDP-N-acetylmuramoyl-L-alanine--D-glutamate ligase [Alphaproteobacteria bacterium]